MASTATEHTTQNAPTMPRGGGRHRRPVDGGSGRSEYTARGRGGRGRRGGRGEGGATSEGRGGSRRPRGVGRGGYGDSQTQASPQGNGAEQTVLRVGQTAPQISATKPDADDAASESEATLCFICADPVKYIAIPPCNHSTCHICSLRMRALYKSKFCTHCRTESEFVIFTQDAEKRFEEFKDSEIIARNDALGIKYDDQAICDDATLLLRYNCPEETCDRACLSWPDLHRHVKQEHSRVMCDLCTRHKKVFTHEHELFTAAELRRHERHGDDVPGSENQSGFKGHPDCGFCNRRFYSVDELFEHCRDKHERCHICDRRSSGNSPQYYVNYDALEAHFKESHFICPDAECLEKKFVVFENEVDLKAHRLEQHSNGLDRGARRDARRIDISHFEDAHSHQQTHDGRRRGRGGGNAIRGRQAPEETPVRTEQNMTRAEIAFYRTQQLIQSYQSTTTRTFGGQLSDQARPSPQQTARPPPQTVEAPPPRPPGGVPGNVPVTQPTNNAAFPPLSSRPQNPPRPSQPSQPAISSVDMRALRHAAVIERASNILRHDFTKMQLFRADISKFRAGAISGNDLVDMFWSLCDVSAKELGTLINEVADLYEDESKRQELLKAWNNWKAINEDYPPIAGASSQSATTSTSAGRVLKLKSSTARSSRSAAARQTSWGTAAASSVSSAAFPTPVQSNPNPNRVGKGNVSATPWVAPQATPPPPATLTQQRDSDTRSNEFPSLPPKRQIPGWTPVQSRSRWETPQAPNSNPWAAASGSGSSGQEQAENSGTDVYGNTGKKKKGKQKQLLFHVGL
ncbi:hypothetical protein BDD12DRAFT_448342 [Trichophaea hybrida]|nr:hypothetical protein BDD12DRAFT_448342 [Trichophaea hybrida]